MIENLLSLNEVRRVCMVIYKKPISEKAWLNWRKWVNCTGKKSLTKREASLLMAIAQLRTAYPKKELNWSDVETVKESILLEYEHVFHTFQSSSRISGQILKGLIPERTLYRKIPGFSVYRYYDRAWVNRTFGIPI